jgi:ribonuclease R
MDIKAKIIELLARPDYAPAKASELVALLELSADAHKAIDEALAELLAAGAVVTIKQDKLCLPRDADLRVGRINFRQSGAAILIPEDGSDAIGVPAEETGVALQGDTVLVRLLPQGKSSWRGKGSRSAGASEGPTARVIRILRRARHQITGTLQRAKQLFHVIPDDPRIVRNIIVADPKSSSLKPAPKVGDKVVVRLEEWKQRHLNPQGEITEVIGRSHQPLTEHAALFITYALEKSFPEAVATQAKQVSVPVGESEVEGRLDLRQMPVFTIDPDDAKDFDDALHLERLEGGRLRVGIHIADVSAYVRPGSHLDREAQRRGNSTYLVGEVVPMLPHELSSGVCSLKEAEDRLTKSVLVTFGPKGEVEKVDFARSVIRSIKRLTYKQAKLFLDEDDLEKIRQAPPPPAHQTGFAGRPLKAMGAQEMKLLQSHIRQMWSIAKRLRQQRMRSGSLDLEMPEAKIYIDAEGYPDRIERVSHDESHQLVEEFMLMANEAVAEALNRQNFPCIHRVHPKPEAEKLDELRDNLQQMGIKVGDLNNSREVAKFLLLTREHPKGVFLRGLFLRSLKQACYRASPDGHFGLSKTDYTHFTSPIRRYADLIVHRVFDAYLYRNALPTAPKVLEATYNVASLQRIAEHISQTEQNSTEAERQSVKNRLLEYFERESKRTPRRAFEAVITDVKNHGFFVELVESMAFGFIHVSGLTNDFYMLSADGQSLVGRKTQMSFAIGDKVRVEVAQVDRFKRQIDFVLLRAEGQTQPPIPRHKTAPAARRSVAAAALVKAPAAPANRSRQREESGASFGLRHGRMPDSALTGGEGGELPLRMARRESKPAVASGRRGGKPQNRPPASSGSRRRRRR